MGKKFVIKAVVTYVQEYDEDWSWTEGEKPDNPTAKDLLADLQKYCKTCDEYAVEAEMMLFCDIHHIKLDITDPTTGESVAYPSKSDMKGKGEEQWVA